MLGFGKKTTVMEVKTTDKRKKRIYFYLFIIIIAVILFAVDIATKNQTVTIAKMNASRSVGDIVVLEDLIGKEITREEYTRDNNREVVNADGSVTSENAFILWSEVEQYLGKQYNYQVLKGQNFEKTFASDKVQFRNPLIEKMDINREIYTMAINPDSIYLHMLYPQSTLRVRVVIQVPMELADEARRAAENKTVYDGSSAVLALLTSRGYAIDGEGVDGFDNASGFSDERTVAISEVIFDELVAVDMLSANRESIYEVYMALLNMPVEKRIPYLRTSFEEDISGEFRNRVTPSSLVFDLERHQANRMLEYETSKFEVKYTIVKKENSGDMLQNFVEINRQIMDEMIGGSN